MSVDRHKSATTAEPFQVWTTCCEMAWQLPFIISARFWDAMHAAMPDTERHRHRPPQDCEGQLIVPDPIEEEGEHALFA